MTPTEPIDSRVEFCSPENSDLQTLLSASPQGIYSPSVINFLNELAEKVLTDKNSRRFPDVMSFAFWCRSIENKVFNEENSHNLGRGVVFHITPGNVPINFAYSLVSGLLSGNTNIVRLPSKKFEQVEFLVCKFNLVLNTEEHVEIKNRMVLIRYPKDKLINDYFSKLCDVRVIWGGNQSIDEIRKSMLPAKSTEITFANRFSLCAINSVEYLKSADKEKIAHGFYNDTYLFDQNACTAPHLIIWIGSEESSNAAAQIFWNKLEILTSKRYSIEPLQIMDKLVASARFSASNPNARLVKSSDNKIFRLEMVRIPAKIEKFKSHSGLFFEVNLLSLDDLKEFLSSDFQTMTYFGFDLIELNNFIGISNLRGIDRVVPIGKSLEFSLIWDGYDLINSLSRKITICE